jgi:hypothetical protein
VPSAAQPQRQQFSALRCCPQLKSSRSVPSVDVTIRRSVIQLVFIPLDERASIERVPPGGHTYAIGWSPFFVSDARPRLTLTTQTTSPPGPARAGAGMLPDGPAGPSAGRETLQDRGRDCGCATAVLREQLFQLFSQPDAAFAYLFAGQLAGRCWVLGGRFRRFFWRRVPTRRSAQLQFPVQVDVLLCQFRAFERRGCIRWRGVRSWRSASG